MPNNRIFYASQSVSVGGTVVQGATSVSLATNFSLEKMYQLGHISVYDQIVNAPEVEVTIAKNLDGNASIYNLATGGGSLVENSADVSTLVLAIGNDTDLQVTSAPTVVMTGCFLKSVKYDMQVEGLLPKSVRLWEIVRPHRPLVELQQLLAPRY